MKRLFFAVDLDEPTREAVDRISASVRQAARQAGVPGRVSWVSRARMHLTLHFLGDADRALEQCALLALAEPVRVAPFNLTFNRLGCFPSSGSPRVLWLGAEEGLSALGRLYEVLGRRLGVSAAAQEPFIPHLTLARFRDRVPRRQIEQITAIQVAAGPCPIDRVTLYETRPAAGGVTYIALAAALLEAST